MRFVASALFAASALAFWPAASNAEPSAAMVGVSVPPAPPEGFDAVAASDEERARYGLPARPKALASRSLSYTTWLQAMKHAKHRLEPALRVTDRRHGPAILRRYAGSQAGTMASTNWSGELLLSGATSYSSASYTEVLAQWLVSAVQQPNGACGGTDLSATWVGIDGASNTSNDVLQAGTEADATCHYGYTSQTIYPWFEWYPNYEIQITNFAVFPGASVFVVVQATGPTTANVTFLNLSNDVYTVLNVTAPAGTSLRGTSAEWIVERPEVGTTLSTLADYGFVQMCSEIAYVANQIGTANYDLPGAPMGGRTGGLIEMVDTSNNPLSTPYALGPTAQVVSVAGAAQ